MGVYIPGMEMPKDIEPGLVIEFADGIDGKRYARLYHYRHGGLTEWLEAVPVPAHGRLIDANARVNVQIYNDEFEDFQTVNMSIDNLLDSSWIEIEDAPIIIPAEDGET